MTYKNALISIYIPTKNRASKLEQALSSCFSQSYQIFEVIVVDDGSTDSTPVVVKNFQRYKQALNYIRFESSRGAPIARNTAINHANGFFITGLDDDDYFAPNRLEDFIRHYESKWSFLCTTAVEVNPYIKVPSMESTHPITIGDIKCRNAVGNQIFIEASRIRSIGGFDSTFSAWQDYDCWFRLISTYGDALKLGNNSIFVCSDMTTRITSSASATIGYKQFTEKHEKLLNEKEKKNQFINDLINRKVKFTLRETIRIGFTHKSTSRMLRLYARTHFPYAYQLLLLIFFKLRQYIRSYHPVDECE